MPYRLTTCIALAALASGCGASDAASPVDLAPAGGANVIAITTPKAVYGWDEVSFAGEGVRATVVNTGTRDYYANIGDAFNGASDQPTVFIALGTDAAVERRTGDSTWTAMPTGLLVEGSKVVRLRAGGRYELRGNLDAPRAVGTMRIRLRYYTAANPAGLQPMVDYSAPFTVR